MIPQLTPGESAAVDQSSALLRDALAVVLPRCLTLIREEPHLPEEEVRRRATLIGEDLGRHIAALDREQAGRLAATAINALAARLTTEHRAALDGFFGETE